MCSNAQAGPSFCSPHPIVALALEILSSSGSAHAWRADRNGEAKLREELLAERGCPERLVAAIRELGAFAVFFDEKVPGGALAAQVARVAQSVVMESGSFTQQIAGEAREIAARLRDRSRAFQTRYSATKPGGSGLPDF